MWPVSSGTGYRNKMLVVLKTVICFRPPENPRNFLRSTSKNKVSGLILSPKHCLVHKPIVAGCACFTLFPEGICEKKNFLLNLVVLSSPTRKFAFVYSHGAMSKHQVLLVSREKATETYQTFEIAGGNEAVTRSHVRTVLRIRRGTCGP